MLKWPWVSEVQRSLVVLRSVPVFSVCMPLNTVSMRQATCLWMVLEMLRMLSVMQPVLRGMQWTLRLTPSATSQVTQVTS